MSSETVYKKEESWEDSAKSVSEILSGKMLKGVRIECGYRDMFYLDFYDGTTLEFYFDWIDELKITKESP